MYRAAVNDIFIQNKKRETHELMNPKNFTIRECCNSDEHPNTIPILLGLDVTGSMSHIPHDLIKEGLPKLMSNMIQHGVKDPSLCFMAIGDHTNDGGPLQMGQFEAADEPLDLWLERTWLERGGGANEGESYLLAWYAAAFLTKCDAFDKQGRKGFLITIGDEPNLNSLPARAIKEITGNSQAKDYTAAELLTEAKKKWNVYHINVSHTSQGRDSLADWKVDLGQNCIEVTDFTTIPDVISNLIVENTKNWASSNSGSSHISTPVITDVIEEERQKSDFIDTPLGTL
jgi:hypothetical protein